MIPRILLRASVLCLTVIAWPFGLAACQRDSLPDSSKAVIANTEIVTVSADDLLKTPAKFAGRRIRVTGYWVQAFEHSYLCADAESHKVTSIWIERWSMPGGREVKNQEAISAALEKAYTGIQSNRQKKRDVLLVTIEGFFDHKTSIETTKESYPFQSGFGHLGQYQSLLTIEKILEAKFHSEMDIPI